MNFYDECLEENEFFQTIKEKHSDIIKKATEEDWIICVPRVGSLDSNVITDEDILENVLIPNSDLPITHFCTLTKQEVCIQGKFIVVNNDYSVHILFDETFYINKQEKYKVWCIDRPLHKKCTVKCDFDYSIVKNVHDCIKLLWTKDRAVLNNANQLIEAYLEESFELDGLNVLKTKTEELFQQSVTGTAKEAHVSLAVETYIQHCVHLKLFRAICNYTAVTDSHFNKILRNLSDIQLKDLDINVVFSECISSTKCQLSNFNKVVTVLGKIECLRRIINVISSQKNLCVTTDDLLKIFVFLVIKSNINNWIANLTYITHFRFSLLNLKDEYSFLITTLEAAIEYIKHADIKVQLRFDNDYLSASFNQVEAGDLMSIKKIFEEKPETLPEKDCLACHPLCNCEKCTLNAIDVNSSNEKGWTALHIACFFGHPHLVEYFLSKNAKVNVFDDLGMTPIHYASLRGHQNALLLLLHAHADGVLKDSNGNTALHWAANNGHESCVKAILYFSEQKGICFNVNLKNNVGDTPLHLSAKWGYAGITKILIQYGADPNVANKWNHTTFDLSHNDYIKKLLVPQETPKLEVSRTSTRLNKISPSVSQNLEQFKRTDLMLKSIKNNDLPLMCYYLGIQSPTMITSKVNTKLICHPLCTCDSCQEQFENSAAMPSTAAEPLNINVCNSEGFTPLHTAAKYGRLNILRLLLDKGALVNVRTTKEQLTPLHLACKHQRIQIVRELLKCGGCNIDVPDAKGNTPLHYACLSNDNGIVELLLLNDCDSSIKNLNGKTAFQEAHNKMYWNILKLFKIKHNNNNTPTFDLFSM